MKKILLSCFLITSILQAQFTLKGTINNYPDKRVIVKLDKAFDNVLIGNTTTNASGELSVPVTEKYNGIIEVSLPDAKKGIILISDNTNINFNITLSADNDILINNPGNTINTIYQNYQEYNNKKNVILPELQSILDYYNPNEDFYIQTKNEIQRISNLKEPDLTLYPLLQYYINASDLVKKTEKAVNANEILNAQNQIINHFKNAGEEFETSGLGRSLLYNYLRSSATGAKNQSEWQTRLDTSIQNLLDQVGEDTGRGQDILSATINFLNSYDINQLGNKYMKKAESLTCEISSDLKNTIEKNNTIKEGKIIPNLKFTHKLNGKYSYLYDIKTNYKLILVWATWCGHCQQEMPFVKQFYDNLKKYGGEIVGLGIEYEKEPWENTVKDLPWLNDSDFLYWDSYFAKELNITGTPTLILVDKNNKILKISSKISDINNLIK